MMKNMMMVMMAVLIVVATFFAFQGNAMHSQVEVEEAKFHELQDEYFTQSKAIRDGAETGSALTEQLVEIRNYPSELLKLKLVGVGQILTGIFILLFGILIALIMMPVRLGMIIKKTA